MKFVAFLLLGSLTLALVLAFPAELGAHSALPAADAAAESAAPSAGATAENPEDPALLREPRHLLKYFLSKPVVVQPIVVQQPYATYGNGYGRGYGYGNSYGNSYYGKRRY
ncbi:uncharacterized protein LOC117892313 [Drosophila subobscura]|uniref:uncharacterized protein LOC117892313 n=1 Tax=Drosophila subobscura TaxID=7241 RepID=UPI00155B37D3|nr:uncharacterized protein LOC117892313 [Drosophila subobscura]